MKNSEFILSIQKSISYDSTTGVLTRKVKAGNSPAGSPCGYLNEKGYVKIRFQGKQYAAHRLAWMIQTGKVPSSQIDHINQTKNDNRWSNLRLATASQNGMNRSAQKNSKSGIKGISWNKSNNYWRASIWSEYKLIYKEFKCKEKAIKWLDEKRSEIHKEYASS